MIIALGNVFDVSISQAAAKSLVCVSVTQQTGRAVFTDLLKLILGAWLDVGSIIGATTAATITEALGVVPSYRQRNDRSGNGCLFFVLE